MKLNNLPKTACRLKAAKRIGCGQGSGHGKTAGRGNKGGNSRSGYSTPTNFSGIPLYRRLPKRGFNNAKFKTYFNLVSLERLECCVPQNFEGIVDRDAMIRLNLIDDNGLPVKVLANGEIKRALSIACDKISASAREKIEAVGGKIITK